MLRKKTTIVTAALACVVAITCSAGCMQASSEPETSQAPMESEAGEASEEPSAKQDEYDPAEWQPEVYTDADGDLIQLTPNDGSDDIAYFVQRRQAPANTYWARADNRGCKSCHDDLAALVHDSPYEHPAVSGVDVEWTVDTCLGCHAQGTNGFFTVEHAFETEIHAIHTDVASCFNCHDTASTGNEAEGDSSMNLWEDVKYQMLRGFTDIAAEDIADTFSYTQDELNDPLHLFNLKAMCYDWDFIRNDYHDDETPLDEGLRDEWSITVCGEVEKPTTFNLGELIENAPKQTAVMKWACMLNPIGGPGVGQVEVTGIPLSYLIEQSGGLTDAATGILPMGIDGFADSGATKWDDVKNYDCILVTQMNGEDIPWKCGYPCILMMGGVGCGCYVKQVSTIEFTETYGDVYDLEGWPNATYEITDAFYNVLGWPNKDYSDYYNNPNVGITSLKEGQVVKTGEPLTISGYADAYGSEIVGVEVSMDRGVTWKRFDVSGTDIQRLVTWNFEFTPDEDRAYYFGVRAVKADGKVTEYPVEKMFVAHSNFDELKVVSLEEHEAVEEQKGMEG